MTYPSRYLNGLSPILATMALYVAGCSPVVLPPTQHAPLAASQVNLYQTPPKKYEAMGIITVPVTPEMQWDERKESIPGFDALKTKAGALGANGVLLVAEPGISDVVATVGYRGTWYQVPLKLNPKQAVARAIFVVE